MIINEEANIILTPEQNAQIELTKSVLVNLELEISIVNKNLKAIKSETERAIKENTYNQDLLTTTNTQLEITKNTLSQLTESIEQKKMEFLELSKDIVEKNTIQSEREFSIKEEENKLAQTDIRLMEKEDNLSKVAHSLSLDKEEFLVKVNKLKEVIKEL